MPRQLRQVSFQDYGPGPAVVDDVTYLPSGRSICSRETRITRWDEHRNERCELQEMEAVRYRITSVLSGNSILKRIFNRDIPSQNFFLLWIAYSQSLSTIIDNFFHWSDEHKKILYITFSLNFLVWKYSHFWRKVEIFHFLKKEWQFSKSEIFSLFFIGYIFTPRNLEN